MVLLIKQSVNQNQCGVFFTIWRKTLEASFTLMFNHHLTSQLQRFFISLFQKPQTLILLNCKNLLKLKTFLKIKVSDRFFQGSWKVSLHFWDLTLDHPLQRNFWRCETFEVDSEHLNTSLALDSWWCFGESLVYSVLRKTNLRLDSAAVEEIKLGAWVHDGTLSWGRSKDCRSTEVLNGSEGPVQQSFSSAVLQQVVRPSIHHLVFVLLQTDFNHQLPSFCRSGPE